MYSISAVKSGHGSRYYHEPQAGSFRSEWMGKGSDLLGLRGDVAQLDFKALLEGYDPSGTKVCQNLRRDRIAAFDATLSAPKSISLGILLDGDRGLLAAHRAAIAETHVEIEKGLQIRIRQNGTRTYEPVEGIVTANFHHTLSRSLDPHIHNHLVILNATFRKGKWRSLYARKGLYERTLEIGRFYRDRLADGVRQLGHKIRDIGKELWELERYPAVILRQFSKRREAIVRHVGMESSAKTRQRASLYLRENKSEIPLEMLYPNWHSRYQKVLKQANLEFQNHSRSLSP